MPKASEIFRNRLAQAIKEKRGLQGELEKSGVTTRQSLYNYAEGKTVPDLDVAEKIANAIGTTLSDLIIGGEGHPIDECFRRALEAIKKARSDEGQYEKPRLAQRGSSEHREKVFAALTTLRDELAYLTPKEQDSFFEALEKMRVQNKS